MPPKYIEDPLELYGMTKSNSSPTTGSSGLQRMFIQSMTVKAMQSLQDLELQPFQQVEQALKLVPTLSPVTLGKREPAALEDKEPDKAETEDVFDIYKK